RERLHARGSLAGRMVLEHHVRSVHRGDPVDVVRVPGVVVRGDRLVQLNLAHRASSFVHIVRPSVHRPIVRPCIVRRARVDAGQVGRLDYFKIAMATSELVLELGSDGADTRLGVSAAQETLDVSGVAGEDGVAVLDEERDGGVRYVAGTGASKQETAAASAGWVEGPLEEAGERTCESRLTRRIAPCLGDAGGGGDGLGALLRSDGQQGAGGAIAAVQGYQCPGVEYEGSHSRASLSSRSV